MNTHRRNNLIIVLSVAFMIILVGATLINFGRKHTNSGIAKHPPEESVETSTENSSEDNYYCSLTADEFVNSITIGWNLGNSFDSCVPSSEINMGDTDSSYYETAWGNPVVTKELIDAVANAGFDSIRLPVTWYYNTYRDENGKLCIYDSWLARVAEVVDYALDNNLYVVLDSHHDESIIWAELDDIDEVSANVTDLWTQIAEYFKDYDEHLLFDAFNEINSKDNSWKTNFNSVKAANLLNQTFVDAVRSCDGYNKSRLLICSPYLNSTEDEILNSFILPTDSCPNRLLIEVHSYNPTYNQDIDEVFLKLQKFAKEKGAPVLIGEFGTTDSFVPLDLRTAHASNYIARAKEYGLRCYWWDDGGGYKLIDRNSYEVSDPDMLSALMNPTEFRTDNIASYSFSSVNDYTYATIDPSNGQLIDSSSGSLTLNVTGSGLRITSSSRYRISLVSTGSGNGICISGIAFYNADNEFIKYEKIDNQSYTDISTPSNATYMKVTIYNPWGYRSLDDYTKYIQKSELYLQITEYKM